MFALLMAINYPFYLLIWLYDRPGEYLGIGLRVVATTLCLALLFRKYWPSKIKKWLPIYWYGTVTYCLPFFFVYMTLKNHGDTLWILNTMSALFFTLIIIDFFSALVVLVLGCLLAWGFFVGLGNQFTLISGTVTAFGVSVTLFAAMVIGSIFTRIRGITEDEKYKELIASEAVAAQRSKLIEQEKFSTLARKVAHDISSPLSALKMMIPLCEELPEDKRISLNRATESIWDIANNLLNNFRPQKNPATSEIEPRQPLLVSDLLIQLLSEKKVEYSKRPVRFTTLIADDTQFAFIQCQPTEFRRAMSNLINNAVDALEDKADGVVTIHTLTYENRVVVEVADNGCGMPGIMIGRMQRRQSFTSGKETGHGLGLQQVWDTLEYNEGAMEVQSTLRQGTSIKLAFARVAVANWIAQDIHFIPDSIIVILDDDESIHAAWNCRFTALLISHPTLRLHHFTQGQEVLDFLEGLSHKEKDCVVFLSDYELLHQDRNGLQIIEASEIEHAILVTSYYSNPKVREESDQLGIKILPKQMASVIPIYIDPAIQD